MNTAQVTILGDYIQVEITHGQQSCMFVSRPKSFKVFSRYMNILSVSHTVTLERLK